MEQFSNMCVFYRSKRCTCRLVGALANVPDTLAESRETLDTLLQNFCFEPRDHNVPATFVVGRPRHESARHFGWTTLGATLLWFRLHKKDIQQILI